MSLNISLFFKRQKHFSKLGVWVNPFSSFHLKKSTVRFSQGACDRLKQSAVLPIVKSFSVVMVLKWLQAGFYSALTRLLHSSLLQDKLNSSSEFGGRVDEGLT